MLEWLALIPMLAMNRLLKTGVLCSTCSDFKSAFQKAAFASDSLLVISAFPSISTLKLKVMNVTYHTKCLLWLDGDSAVASSICNQTGGIVGL